MRASAVGEKKPNVRSSHPEPGVVVKFGKITSESQLCIRFSLLHIMLVSGLGRASKVAPALAWVEGMNEPKKVYGSSANTGKVWKSGLI